MELNEHIQSRLNKLAALKDAGIAPYGGAFEATHRAAGLLETYAETTTEALEATPVACCVAGRIMTTRVQGKVTFAHMQDATGRIQIFFSRDLMGEAMYAFAKRLDDGDIVGVEGKLFRTRRGELTVEAKSFTMLTKSLRPLPEKWHGLKDIETRYRQRYVDLIVNPDVKDTFKKRSAIIKAIRDFLETHGFMEVETPMMQPIPGGATARPFITHHNALGMDLYLRIAPELYLKRLLVGGFERVFELNRNFRNEGISTKHNPEFSMLEFYIAYKDYRFLMEFTEQMFQDVVTRSLGTLKIPYGESTIDLTPPWPRVAFYDSLIQRGVPAEILTDRDKAISWARSQKMDIPTGANMGKVLDEIFSCLVEPHLIQPTFITDYPVELSPLAKRRPDKPELVERFELFIAGRELANAFSELNDPIDQRGRFDEQVKVREGGDEEGGFMDEDFVRALEFGMPPAAGEGIGIDRLVMLLTNSHSIRDVLLFPHMRTAGPVESPQE